MSHPFLYSLSTLLTHHGASRVRWRPFLSTSASSMRLLCAKPSRFAPISLAKPPPGCTRGRLRTPEPVVVAEGYWLRPGTAFGLSFPAYRPGPFRSRVADDYARLEPVAIPLTNIETQRDRIIALSLLHFSN